MSARLRAFIGARALGRLADDSARAPAEAGVLTGAREVPHAALGILISARNRSARLLGAADDSRPAFDG